MIDTARRPGRWDRLFVVLILALVALNFLLSWRISELKATIGVIKAEGQLQPGDLIPPLEVKTLDGTPIVIGFESPTIIYVMSPSCPWCAKNTANIAELARALDPAYQVVGLSLSSVRLTEHVAASGYSFAVYSEPSAATLVALKVGGTPETVVVSAGGKVLRSWRGAFSRRSADEVSAYFGVHLPGLVEPGAELPDALARRRSGKEGMRD
jgi:hypothetical protein